MISDLVINGLQKGSVEQTSLNFQSYFDKLILGKIASNHSDQRENQLRDAELFVLQSLSLGSNQKNTQIMDSLLLDKDIPERLEKSGMLKNFIEVSVVRWIENHKQSINQLPTDAYQFVLQMENILKMIKNVSILNKD